MKVNELSSVELIHFCSSDDLKLEISFYGGRKFTTTIKIGDAEQKVLASAKDIYAALRAKETTISSYEEVKNTFYNLEIQTRDRSVYSKQLNVVQKICYFVVKMFCGLSISDTSNGAQSITSKLKTLKTFLVRALENKDLRKKLDALKEDVNALEEEASRRNAGLKESSSDFPAGIAGH